jgi:methylated-DNA-[protein]-cysteine S-methyltransferase
MLPDQSESKRFSVALKGVRPIAGQATASKTLVASMTRFLAQYFAGQAPSEAPCLDLDGVAPFQADVLRALRATPHGRIVTYGQLARLAGRPGAARAVGQAMARNPLPLAIPCHRVLAGAMGMPRRLGGFGPGLPLKCWLLRWEGHASWIEEPTRAGAQVGEPRQGRRRDNLG